MALVNASAVNALQTRINAERGRRGQSPIAFTDQGVITAGDVIKAAHSLELRSGAGNCNSKGTFPASWSGSIAAGQPIVPDDLQQIENYLSRLEGELLASWGVLLLYCFS